MKLDKECYEKGMASLKKQLEEDEEMFDRWVFPDGEYALISTLMEREGIPDATDSNKTMKILGRYYCKIGSNSVEALDKLWESEFFQHSYDSTVQHFIVDIKNKKVVKFLSVCM